MYLFMGGSFDPVHLGHLRIATEVAECFGAPLHLLPCKEPVHKKATWATSDQRLAMLDLSVAGDERLAVDSRELKRASASYTIDTLMELKQSMGVPVVMVVGSDSALALASWRNAKEFSKLCHLLVLKRPGSSHASLPSVLEALKFQSAATVHGLCSVDSGMAMELEVSQLEISSSDLRERVRQKKSIRYLVTDAVEGYICDNGLYNA
jgi:nicotinate-nucleotide adenylyltransferase